MRHRKKINSLGRKAAHRKETMSSMATALILHKRINTTVAKAKALRTYVEPLITRSKTDNTHSRRMVFSYLKNKYAVSELFREVSQKVADRPGGYTRILKTGFRQGDAAEMCFIELVDYNTAMLTTEEETQQKRTRRGRRRGKKKGPAAEQPAAETAAPTAETETPEAGVAEPAETAAEEQTQPEVAEEAPKAEETAQPEAKTEEAPEEEPAEAKKEETPAQEEEATAEKKKAEAKADAPEAPEAEQKEEKPSEEGQEGEKEDDKGEK